MTDDTSGTENPDTDAHDTDAHDTDAHDTDAHDVHAPDADAPDSEGATTATAAGADAPDEETIASKAGPDSGRKAAPVRPGGRVRLGAISGRMLAVVALAVVLIAAVVSTVVLGLRYTDARATEQARESALAAARAHAENMFGYNPANVGEHVDKSLDVLTGKAKPEYVKLITDSNLVAEVGKQKVVSEVTLQGAGVVTNTRDTAKVLLFMNQSVTRGNKELVSINPSRLTFSMQKDGDRWLINDIEVITDDTLRSKIEVVESLPPGAKPLPGQPTSTPAPSSAIPSSPAPAPVPTP